MVPLEGALCLCEGDDAPGLLALQALPAMPRGLARRRDWCRRSLMRPASPASRPARPRNNPPAHPTGLHELREEAALRLAKVLGAEPGRAEATNRAGGLDQNRLK